MPRKLLIGPISPAASGALYEQIVDAVKREVSEGRLAPNTALPSFRNLAEDLLVSVITVKRAYLDLETEGVIVTRHGKGSFVAEVNGLAGELKEEQLAEHLQQAADIGRQLGLTEEQLAERLRRALKNLDPKK